jgi:Domain of unknown function (DUF4920)
MEVSMMRSLLFATSLLMVVTSVATRGEETFGAAPTVKDATPIAQLLATPADFQGKTVRVEGIVTDVCTMMGCWMGIAPADAPTSPAVLIKVDDGVIVFPTSARGKRATAQGVMERVGAADKEGQEAAREHAEHAEHAEHGAGAKAEETTSWQIKATGAIVY